MTLRVGTSDPVERARGLAAAAAAVRRGRIVGLPLDFSYGIAADAFSEPGVTALRSAKGRPDLAVPVLVPKITTVSGIARPDAVAHALMRDFWPGGLTLVLPAQASLAWSLTDARGRIAVRQPLHPVALELLERVGPMAAVAAGPAGPSAPTAPNPNLALSTPPGQPATTPAPAPSAGPTPATPATLATPATPAPTPTPDPTPAPAPDPLAAVFPPELADQLAVLLDAGALPGGPPSTVVDLTGPAPVLLRAGAIEVALLRAACPGLVVPAGRAADAT